MELLREHHANAPGFQSWVQSCVQGTKNHENTSEDDPIKPNEPYEPEALSREPYEPSISMHQAKS